MGHFEWHRRREAQGRGTVLSSKIGKIEHNTALFHILPTRKGDESRQRLLTSVTRFFFLNCGSKRPSA